METSDVSVRMVIQVFHKETKKTTGPTQWGITRQTSLELGAVCKKLSGAGAGPALAVR